jgi:hypothetical protein
MSARWIMRRKEIHAPLFRSDARSFGKLSEKLHQTLGCPSAT